MGIGTNRAHAGHPNAVAAAVQDAMAVNVDGRRPDGVSAKDIILALIARNRHRRRPGAYHQYQGGAIESLSMEGRMTICNAGIEAGARAGMVKPDETTYAFLRGHTHPQCGGDTTAQIY